MIAERLRSERKRMHATQPVMAQFAGITVRTYAGWEGGESEPNTAALVALAASGVDVQYVITGVHLPTDQLRAYQRAAIVTLEQRDPKLAELLIASYPAISGVSNDPAAPLLTALTSRESELLSNYRSADKTGKTVIEQTSATLAKPVGIEPKK